MTRTIRHTYTLAGNDTAEHVFSRNDCAICRQIDDNVAAERERCAVIARNAMGADHDCEGCCAEIEQQIRRHD